MTFEEVGAILAKLERGGVVVRVGVKRDPQTGELQPAYVTASSLGLMSEEEEQRRVQALSGNGDKPLQ
jgi:hypothetical protein